MQLPRPGGGLLLIHWARSPGKADRLFEILRQTRDDELEMLMRAVGGPSGHIAWAEYGRRKYGITFGIEDGIAVPYVMSTLLVWN